MSETRAWTTMGVIRTPRLRVVKNGYITPPSCAFGSLRASNNQVPIAADIGMGRPSRSESPFKALHKRATPRDHVYSLTPRTPGTARQVGSSVCPLPPSACRRRLHNLLQRTASSPTTTMEISLVRLSVDRDSHAKGNVIRESPRELPTLLCSPATMGIKATKVLVDSDSKVLVDKDISCQRSAVIHDELIKAALRVVFESDEMCATRATAGLMLATDISRLNDTENKAQKCVGRAILERLFLNSMPKDLIEVTDAKSITQTQQMFDFLEFLASKGSSLRLNIMFCANIEGEQQVSPSACEAHQNSGASCEDGLDFQICVALVATDRDSSENMILKVRLVSYRYSESGKNLSQDERDERFERAIDCSNYPVARSH